MSWVLRVSVAGGGGVTSLPAGGGGALVRDRRADLVCDGEERVYLVVIRV